MKNKIKRMVVIITKDGGTTHRETIGDDLEKEELWFMDRVMERVVDRVLAKEQWLTMTLIGLTVAAILLFVMGKLI